MGRLKTGNYIVFYYKFQNLSILFLNTFAGTPPRIEKSTIDFSKCDVRFPDKISTPFSFMNETVWLPVEKQLNCYLTYTTKKVEKIIKDNMHCNLHVTEEICGPRYCPSIESKILKFNGHKHPIWLEPEGLDSPLTYPAGLSCTLPAEKQEELIKCIPALENAKMSKINFLPFRIFQM